MRILVTGATGFIGSRLVPTLAARGHEVVALTRDAAEYDGAADAVREGDVLETGSFEEALADVDAAYYLIHSMGSGEDFAERDRRGARNFRAAADAAGIERTVYLSGLGDEDAELSKHLQSRREVERILADGAFDLTVLRAAVVIGDGNESFRIVAQLARRLPVMVTPRWVRTDCQPIAVADVVAYLAGVLERPATAGATYEVGGPAVLTYEAFLDRTADVAGRPSVIVPVPVLTPRLSTYWVDLVTDVPGDVVRPLVRGLRNEVTAEDGDLRRQLPVPLSDYESAIARALDDGDDPGGDSPEGGGRAETDGQTGNSTGAVNATAERASAKLDAGVGSP